MKQNTLGSKERLKHQKSISNIITNGKKISFGCFLLRYYVFQDAADVNELKAAFTIPKRLIKQANKRNLLKRRLKESYRQTKSDLILQLATQKLNCHLLWIYTSKEINDFQEIDYTVQLIMHKLVKRISNLSDEENHPLSGENDQKST